MPGLAVKWLGGELLDREVAVLLLKGDELADADEECPILLEPLKDAGLDGLVGGVGYEIQGARYVAAELGCCGKRFNTLALATHWMIHAMRCPLCRTGFDEPLSALSLPLSCREALLSHVSRIRGELSDEAERVDVEFIESELLPESLVTNLLLIRRWDLVSSNLQLQVILIVSPSDTSSVLEHLNRGTSSHWTQCSTGVCTFVDLHQRGENDGVCRFGVQRGHCRRLSKAFRDVGATRVSFGVCYVNGHSIFHVAHTGVMHVRLGSATRHGSNIYYVNDNAQVEVGELYFDWMDEQQKSVQGIGFSLLTDMVMQRLVYGMICVYQLMESDRVFSNTDMLSVFYM